MNSQFSQQPKLEQDPQQIPYSVPPLTNQDRIQYYPIFYIKQNNQSIHTNIQQLPNDQLNGWFVCHPVMQNDPFFPQISNFSQFIHKPPSFNPDIPIKIEDDEEIPQPQQSQQFQEANSNKNNEKSRSKKQKDQNKFKRNVDNIKDLEVQPCNCSQSNCLKRYCACFHSGRMCLDECQCKDCKNCTEFAEERDEAINHVYKKCHRDKKVPVNELLSLQLSYGCKCKSTGCQKKYCECFKRGQICGDQCSCEDCLNIPLSLSQKDLKRKKTVVK
ncbi:unnamed protein product [Paramecium primaurelia]|uniref:CRC domain-containing protein n=1 Tax=Paramecium primaurelia TaxID=5886 RepID=A0A8S1K4P9_PARPR|nr:unnamed protein product [Paramecium primaurelia]